MSDAARDLYSFLRSKDFINEDDTEDGAPEGEIDDGSPRLRAVDGFDASDASSSDVAEAASESASGDVSASELDFHEDGTMERLHQYTDDQLNKAPFGIIRVSDEGKVEFFNQYESNLSGVDPSDAEGANFFTQVAPCSNNRIFRGRFKDGVRKGDLDEKFTYTYTYKMKPTLVDVHMHRDEQGHNWIAVQKR